MIPNCYHTSPCKLCRFGSKVFGHGLTRLLGKKWHRVTLEDVRPSVAGLNLTIVGGLVDRGYTEHDIDVIGDEKNVPILVKRLMSKNISNLVHYCGPSLTKHSHWRALINGFLVTFLGNKIYLKNSF